MRARLRAELTTEIKEAARRHMAEEGSATLSLRAIARELGMVSSAIYRYFPSRDDLLTALIVDAYDAVAEVAERADTAAHRRGIAARWLSVAGAIRAWAAAHPAEYGLIYGSPVPGYQAPQDTVGPSARVSFALLRLLAEGLASGEIQPGAPVPIPKAVRHDFAGLREQAGVELPDEIFARGLLVWTQLFGHLTFELFGHLHGLIEDYDALFEAQMRRSVGYLMTGAA